MVKLDYNFLQKIGLGSLPPQDQEAMLQHIYETLELRVGMRLAEQMSDAQLDEFEGFIDRKDDQGALKWLETNLPHYKQVVAEELEKLESEIKENAAQILQASQAQGVQHSQPQQAYPAAYPPSAPAVGPPGSYHQSPPAAYYPHQPASQPHPSYSTQQPPVSAGFGHAPQPQQPAMTHPQPMYSSPPANNQTAPGQAPAVPADDGSSAFTVDNIGSEDDNSGGANVPHTPQPAE